VKYFVNKKTINGKKGDISLTPLTDWASILINNVTPKSFNVCIGSLSRENKFYIEEKIYAKKTDVISILSFLKSRTVEL